MKKTLKQLFSALAESEPNAAFRIVFWDGEKHEYGEDGPDFILSFNTQKSARKFITGGVLGFGEEYMAGNISVQGDFHKLTQFGTNPNISKLKFSPWTKLNIFLHYLSSLDTTRQAPKNIARHYDLGNNFFQLWLDKSMTYSCAYFRSEDDNLELAQQQKYEHICRKLQLKEGESLIDIGCGWGGMLLYAARHYQIKGVGCTLSQQQYEYATERVRKDGLEDQIEIKLQDYRELTGEFDKFVSIGMFEHVGKKFIPQFVQKTHQLLKPGALGLLHTIGKEKATPGDPWAMRYIFPGGYIPILDEIVRAFGEHGLIPNDMEDLRLHYARTLDEWGKRFEKHVDKVEALFDDSFVRMWRMFLIGSAAGFRFGNTRLYQFIFTNGLNNTLPITRDLVYA